MSEQFESPDFYEAVVTGSVGEVQALIKAGADVNGVVASGDQPLHLAATFGNPDVVRVLIDAGADVSSLDDNGYTALHLAARYGNLDVVNILIEAGAEIHAQTAHPELEEENGLTALHLAAAFCQPYTAKVLINAGANVNAKNATGWSPMHYAIDGTHANLAKILSDAGVDMDELDDMERNLLDFATDILENE